MSDPVRYSVCNTILDDSNSNSDSIASTSDMQMQRRLSMGQLGTPDAAAAILDNIYGYSQLRKSSTEQLFEKLHESLALETKFQPCLYLPEDSRVSTADEHRKLKENGLFLNVSLRGIAKR